MRCRSEPANGNETKGVRDGRADATAGGALHQNVPVHNKLLRTGSVSVGGCGT